MDSITNEKMHNCRLCPRECGADRAAGKKGYCLEAGTDVMLARAALHMWEEPCISGEKGSGTVFFCGCPLRCVYCQNHDIAAALYGKPVSIERLSEIFIELADKGAVNINLVTPTHYSLQIKEALLLARGKGLEVPVVYNCSGYEKPETLESLEGLIDVYLTDFKYIDEEPAKKYSNAPDYPEAAKKSLAEMVRQTGEAEFSEDGLMKRGVIARHLLLPGHVNGAKRIVDYIYDTYGDAVWLSLMNQYTPLAHAAEYPELMRRVTKREYDRVIAHAIERGVTNCFIQEGETAAESFIPAFDGEGI